MKSTLPSLILGAFIGSLSSASGAIVPILNGDFETPGGDSWDEGFGTGTYSFNYPTTGGNPDGHAQIDNSNGGGGFGLLVSNNNVETSLVSLGLTAGKAYTFSLDMTIFSGANIGGFKVDFFNAGEACGSTNDLFPNLIGDGSTWETYSFDVPIPEGVDGLKVVLLWGADSNVGFDNVQVDDTELPQVTSIPNSDFEAAAGASEDWASNSGFGTFVITYPETGGNPGGHAVMDNSASDGGFGVLVTNSSLLIPLAGLGLTAGETYVFSQDMTILSGSNIGGFKVDFFAGSKGNGSTGDMYPTLIGDGSTWETYDFQVSIPVSATGVKLVPLWGPSSVVGYDNVTFDPTPVDVPPITGIPNGDFDDGNMSWVEAGAPDTTFEYPTSGGNPGSHGVMTNVTNNDQTDFGIWIGNGAAALPLAALGLEAGNTYVFSQDMIILSGSNIGGLKIDFFNGATDNGSTGDIYLPLIGNGSTWETYDFEISIPANTDGIKVVPLWGPDSSVGYDNFTFDSTPIDAPAILNTDFESGSLGWAKGGEPNTVFSFPSTGGNPGGHAVMTNNGLEFGVLVANNNSIIPLEDLSLVVGETYNFTQDMILFSGSNIGGLKIEFTNNGADNGSTGDMFASLMGDGTTWETYSFEVTIPFGTDGLKLVPLWGPNSSVGYDNIAVRGSDFNGWIANFPGVGNQTGFLDDPDGDGHRSGLENFFGTDPSAVSEGLTLQSLPTPGDPTFIFSHPQNDEPADDLSAPTYSWSTDLENFYNSGVSNDEETTTVTFSADTIAGVTTVVATMTGDVIPDHIFVRVSVSQTSP